MSTGDLDRLERVERLLEGALHDADHVAVDLRGGRARLAPRLADRQRAVRRRWVICVAASILAAVVVTTSMVLGLSGDKDSLPVAPSPELTFSPSGLPVGLLVGKVDRTEPRASSTIRMTVRPDGTGIWNAGTVGDSEGNSTADFAVEFVREGPGGAVVRQPENWCGNTEILTLRFSVRGRTLVIKEAKTTGSPSCGVSRGLASDMAGTTMRIRPGT